ncbi:membrane protein [Cellulomonas soli]|uniref:Membrane protein n=1 Tax=Cellulomonas soli TaxID=931535 RepID=A0A512P9P7_9CELL|nr:putative membrane protein YczE [Cellulomonas soli]GEP67921.1 membrane protein [Cellulomonas soli]
MSPSTPPTAATARTGPTTPDLPAAPDRAPVRRGAQLLVGLVLFSLSIAMLVHAGLGSMPWDVLSQGISRRTGYSFGTVTLVLSALVLAGWIPLRQRPGIGTIANVLVIGVLVDPALALLDRLPDPLPLVARIALVVAGIALNAVATGLYIGARLGPGPRDGLMTGLVARTGRSVRLVRTSIEVVVVAAGWLLGGTVGLGTLAFAVAIGPLVHLLLPLLSVRTSPVAPAAADDRQGAVHDGQGAVHDGQGAVEVAERR